MTGGNVVEILKDASDHLQVRMETEAEIRASLSGIAMEKNLMLLMPFFMMVYLNLTSSSYAAVFYQTISGRVIISLLLLVLVVCYYWTEMIMHRCSSI